MNSQRCVPDDPLLFIRDCVAQGRIYWTYHVNMRMRKRFIPRQAIVDAATSYEIIESYPEDKYLPSYLVFLRQGENVYHVVFAADVDGGNVRIITAYAPDPDEWDSSLKRRI